MQAPNFYWAVYLILENDTHEILFQKRANTWYRDGEYQLPSWHIEWEESLVQAMIREAKEELDIDIDPSDLNLLHISHRISIGRVYFDTYLKAAKYSGELKNNEPDKCSEIVFKQISDCNPDDFDIQVLEKIAQWIYVSDILK